MEILLDALVGICAALFWCACIIIALAGFYLLAMMMVSLMRAVISIQMTRIENRAKTFILCQFQVDKALTSFNLNESAMAVSILHKAYQSVLLSNTRYIRLLSTRNKIDHTGLALVTRHRNIPGL